MAMQSLSRDEQAFFGNGETVTPLTVSPAAGVAALGVGAGAGVCVGVWAKAALAKRHSAAAKGKTAFIRLLLNPPWLGNQA
jgi:hypothetical protein